MKWFKHFSNASEDESISYILEEMGPEGYGIYFLILETISMQMNEENKTYLKYSSKKWMKLLHISKRSWVNFTKTLKESQEILNKKQPLLIINEDDKFIEINCPNLLKFRDETTRKKSKTNSENSGMIPEQLRNDSGTTPELIEESRIEERESRVENPPAQNPVDQKMFYATQRGKGIQNSQPLDSLDFSEYKYPDLVKQFALSVVCWDSGAFNSYILKFEEYKKPLWEAVLLKIQGFKQRPSLSTVLENFEEILAEKPHLNQPEKPSISVKEEIRNSLCIKEIQHRITVLEREGMDHERLIENRENENPIGLKFHLSEVRENYIKSFVGSDLWDTYINLLELRKVNYRPGENIPRASPESIETIGKGMNDDKNRMGKK